MAIPHNAYGRVNAKLYSFIYLLGVFPEQYYCRFTYVNHQRKIGFRRATSAPCRQLFGEVETKILPEVSRRMLSQPETIHECDLEDVGGVYHVRPAKFQGLHYDAG
jgi:hypothetical protein